MKLIFFKVLPQGILEYLKRSIAEVCINNNFLGLLKVLKRKTIKKCLVEYMMAFRLS